MDNMEKNIELTCISEKEFYTMRSNQDLAYRLAHPVITDLAYITGAKSDYYLSTIKKTANSFKNIEPCYILRSCNRQGELLETSFVHNDLGIRPSFSSKELLNWFNVNNIHPPEEYGFFIYEYGYYPQAAVYGELKDELEEKFKKGKLKNTGNSFTLNKFGYMQDGIDPLEVNEYECKGKRYVRVQSMTFTKLSTGERVYDETAVWLEVEPVKWIYNEDTNTFISLKVLIGGVNLINQCGNKDVKFEDTDIYKFENKYMKKDMFNYRKKIHNHSNDDKEDFQGLNLDIHNIDNIYIQLDKDKDINRIFVLYGNGSVEMRNRNKDGNKEFKDKIKDFIELTGIKKEDNKIWKLKDNRENKILFEELAKKYYLKKFEYVIAIINDNIVSLTSKVGKNSNNKYEQAIVELDKIKDTMVQYIEQVKEGNFDFIMDGYIDENEMEMLKLRELVEHVDSNLPSVSEVEEDIETLETNLTVIDNLVDADDLKRR